jgi:hypothetical protein
MNAPEYTGVTWRKSTRSGSTNDCVEVAALPAGRRAVRDSKNPDGPALEFSSAAWASLLSGLKAGELAGPTL